MLYGVSERHSFMLISSFFLIQPVHTELLYIHEKDLSDELRKSLEIMWEHIRTALKRFDYYFGYFTEQQVDYGER